MKSREHTASARKKRGRVDKMECVRRLCAGCALRRCTYENTKAYIPRIEYGKVVRVYDGDTLHLAFRESWRKPACRLRVRLAGVDCAELRSADPDEKWVARRSKRLLEERVLGKTVRLHRPLRWDKYGRLLADLATPAVPSVSGWMIEHADAIRYDGGTKTRVDWAARRRALSDPRTTKRDRVHGPQKMP